MKVFIGADHRGFELKSKLIAWLGSYDYQVEDCGAFQYEQTDDYPDFAKVVSEKVVAEKGSRGIVICGGGSGVVMAANKIKGVRCTLGFKNDQIKAGRIDDDVNILAIASDFTDEGSAQEIVRTFLETEFDPSEKHARRIEKLTALES